jgi:hypothetical protein
MINPKVDGWWKLVDGLEESFFGTEFVFTGLCLKLTSESSIQIQSFMSPNWLNDRCIFALEVQLAPMQ